LTPSSLFLHDRSAQKPFYLVYFIIHALIRNSELNDMFAEGDLFPCLGVLYVTPEQFVHY